MFRLVAVTRNYDKGIISNRKSSRFGENKILRMYKPPITF